MEELQKNIGYRFKKPALLKMALTHSSYSNESKTRSQNNERLEFLGDSVLSVVVSDYIYKTYRTLPEGELTKMRASLVCERSLHEFASRIELGKYLLLGKGEENTGGRTRSSVLANAFEALIAAIYLDGGIDCAREFVLKFVVEELTKRKATETDDYKTALQEIVQHNPEERISYVLVEEKGPDHEKEFVVEVRLNSNVIGRGVGKSKKSAEQLAAKEALALMGK